MPGGPRRDDAPHDRVTRLCEAAMVGLEGHPECREGDQVLVLVRGVEGKGGTVARNLEIEQSIEILAANLAALLQLTGRSGELVAFEAKKPGDWGL